MQSSDIPFVFGIPFASAAGGSFIREIPQASQIGSTDGRASLHDGFPPLNFLPVGAGGVPVSGQDMNGILYRVSAWTRWNNAGGPIPYNSGLSTDMGGYPKGALVASATTFGLWWYCLTEANTTDPDASGAGWAPVTMGIPPAGEYKILSGATAGPLQVVANGQLLVRASYPALWTYAQASGNIAANDGAWTAGQYSPGDGSTTFRIPRRNGYFSRAYDPGALVNPDATPIGGVQASQNLAHLHGVPGSSTDSGVGFAASGSTFESGAGIFTASEGGSEARPSAITDLWVITTGLRG